MKMKNLIKLRKSLGLNQEEMGKVISVQKTTYACYENKIRNIPIEKLNIIADKYHNSLSFLCDISNVDKFSYSEKKINLKEVGSILKNERKKLGKSQKDLAEDFQVAQSRISDYENGIGISLPILVKYSNITGKSIDYLCGKIQLDKISKKKELN